LASFCGHMPCTPLLRVVGDMLKREQAGTSIKYIGLLQKVKGRPEMAGRFRVGSLA